MSRRPMIDGGQNRFTGYSKASHYATINSSGLAWHSRAFLTAPQQLRIGKRIDRLTGESARKFGIKPPRATFHTVPPVTRLVRPAKLAEPELHIPHVPKGIPSHMIPDHIRVGRLI